MATATRDNGRPAHVYGRWRPNAIEHDVLLSRFFALSPDWHVERGGKLERNADAVCWIGQQKAYVELDTGSMSLRKVRRRWDSYLDCDGIVLVVTTSEKRLERLREASTAIGDYFLITTLDRLAGEPLGYIWSDINGDPCRIG